MNNHHDIVYVPKDNESKIFLGNSFVTEMRCNALKDVFVFTKEELINFIDECNKTMDADNERPIFPFDFITKKFGK